MLFFRHTSRQIQLRLGLLFSLLFLCSLETTLHIHALEHTHHHFGHHSSANLVNSHHHVNKIHFSHNSSHYEHHSNIVEFNAVPDGVLKNITNNPFSLFLFAFLFVLILPIPLYQMVQRHRETKLILYGRYLMSPPLRAPPNIPDYY